MAIFFVLIASCFTSLSNFCLRRSIDSGGTSKAFLMIQLTIATIVALIIGPIRAGEYTFNGSIAFLGIGAGLILGFMLLTLGRALEKGPPGLTIATLNAATVMPAIIMALLFGAAFGYIYTPWHAIGSVLVLAGLFWAGKGLNGLKDKRIWLVFVTLMFVCHLSFLVVMQWRALILNGYYSNVSSLFTAREMASQWFMTFIYLAAALLMTGVYLATERRRPKTDECYYGVFGGVANSLSTFFLIWATEKAGSLENAVIFPIFSVGVIVICNVWGQKLYQEQVNWKACQVCALGLVVGTVDWPSFFAALGIL